MHEASLVHSLLDQVRRLADTQKAEAIERIEVEIGPLSGVVAELMASAFLDLRPELGFAETELVIEQVSLLAECPDCGGSFELLDFDFHCPHGCAGRVRVIQGEGCILKRVTLRVPEEESEKP